ncbi:autotransporter outer membrane beta-barrel domain-containing protein [Microvirga sp. W0021]|uniref:Autotransporter outer membrane beta-barrel domain-containing protein n=1 Tax=Hohaiivirga grylli TaxID=3133970 RepID=A0ABV0BGI0_9HYPH
MRWRCLYRQWRRNQPQYSAERGWVNSQCDVLVVDSTAQGASSTMINVIPDAASAGAYTTGNGILLIEVLDNTASAAGIFMLAQPVILGAYEYTLYHNGRGTDASDGNWYLRNTAPDIIDPVDPPITVIPPVGPDPDPGVVTPIETTRPNIQPGVPVAMAMILLATQYGYAMLDTLHERVGETYPQQPIPVIKQYYVTDKLGQRQLVKIMPRNQEREAWFRGAWARLIGERGLRDRGNFTRHGADYVYNFGGIQAGIDVYAREQSDQTLDKVGLYVGYGQIRSKVTAAYGGKAGTIDMDAYTIGGYWIHFSPNNWYTDAVVQGTWYSSDSSTVTGQRLKSDGLGLIASLEGGYTFNLKDGWAIEPQAQVVYQNVSFDKFNDGRALYDVNSGDSLRGRVGLRIKKDWNTAFDQAKPRLITTWLRANVWHEFLGNSKLTVPSTQGYKPGSVLHTAQRNMG